jgi:hypothetical protein
MSDHWYTKEGTPRHTIIGKNGKERAVTLRDARTEGLCPSVTTVLQVIAKPQLEAWKVKQGILAALTLTRKEGEGDDEYLARVLDDSRQQAATAAEEGTRIHDAIEASWKGQSVPDAYLPHVEATKAKVAELFPGVIDWVPEAYFAHENGFAGKCDLHSPSTGIVVDYKGKDLAPGDDKKLAYDQHYQLGGYHGGLKLPPSQCANIFVSRTHPGHVAAHVWTTEEVENGWAIFLATLKLWKALKGYDPVFSR